MMKNSFKSKIILIKETKIWFFFLSFFLIPIYKFIWEFIINFQGKIYYYIWKLKKNEFYDLKNNDSLLIKNNPKFISIAKEIINSIDNKLIEESIQKIKLKKETHPFGNYTINLYERLSDLLKQKIINFALLEKNITTAANHLKVFPILGKIQVYLNIPIKDSKIRGAQFWHRDDFGFKSLDIFIAVTDVDKESGPFFFVKKKHPLGVFFKIKNVIANPEPGERNKVKLDSFSKYYSENDIGTLIGKSGDGLFSDNFSMYHRGGFCLSKNRIMLRISYLTPEASVVQNLNHDNGFHYLSKIKKNNIQNIFERYLFFKKINFIYKSINLPNKLTSLYQLLHFKK